jgi:ribose 1,5-bisphosphokinase PhnN
MWKITTRGFTLEEVLIMAAMNLLERRFRAQTRETVTEITRRPSMQLKRSIKRAAAIATDSAKEVA